MKGDICSIEGCNKIVKFGNICQGHNWRMKNFGSYDQPSRRKHGELCKVDGCTNARDLKQRSSLCTMHRIRMSRHKSMDIPKKELPPGIIKICIHHGELTEKDVYKVPGKTWLNCKICKTLRSEALRNKRPTGYKQTRNFIFIGKKENYLKVPISLYEEMLKTQNGLCKICSKPETMLSNGKTRVVKKLAIDHDHDTKKIRGLLCHRCNTGIGGFYESIELLQSAIDYLKQNA